MTDRQAKFLALQEERLAALAKKKSDRKEANQSTESLDTFIKQFTALTGNIEQLLEQLTKLTSEEDKKSRLATARDKALQLQTLLNESLAFLPAYELRKSQDKVTGVHDDIARLQQECLPKKKFAFGKKKNVASNTPHVLPSNVLPSNTKFARYTGDVIYENRANETLDISKCEIHKKDVLLKNLASCTVKLHSTIGTLHCTNCTDCTFSVGPISGSLFLENCNGSVYHVTCQQARVHSTHNAVFYIHVTSKAIIEDCKGLKFGRRVEVYEGYEDDRVEAGLADTNNWNDVDDFNWLSKEHSPNWEAL